ncbi:MAG: slipin family protein [Desulforhopalus sp.]
MGIYLKYQKIRSYERGLLFADRELKEILEPGGHWCADITGKTRVDIVSKRETWLYHDDLDLIVSSGHLGADAHIIELADNERGLVWIEKRFAKILGPGLHVLWKGYKDVLVERVDASSVVFNHKEIRPILESESAADELTAHMVDDGHVGVLFIDGKLQGVLQPGCHSFWQRTGKVKLLKIDIRECTLDIAGQEIISHDKVSIRLNGLVTYKVTEPVMAVTEVSDYGQSLYRETQLALRAAIGTRDIDSLLADKDSLALKVREALAVRVKKFGLTIIGFGIRDIILPGDMKELLNKVVESKKAAEANLITRREETAAMRSQANTAKILAGNPTLMKLRELELLEKVAASSNLSVVCGEGSLSENIINLI